MKKFSFTLALAMSFFVLFVSMSYADDYNPDADYSLEIFTTNTPFNQGSEHPHATTIFSNDENIYLVARYYTKVSGMVDHILIVTNAAGQVIDLSSYTIQRDVNPHSLYFRKNYPSGSYTFTMFISGPGGMVMSPHSYSFVVK
jgi:hypothetical protein